MILKKETEFTATYKYGNTEINIIAPKDVTEEIKKKILEEIHTIGWKIVKQELDKTEES